MTHPDMRLVLVDELQRAEKLAVKEEAFETGHLLASIIAAAPHQPQPAAREAAQRVQAYLARHAKNRHGDRVAVHGYDVGEPSESVLLVADLKALSAGPEEAPEGAGEVTELMVTEAMKERFTPERYARDYEYLDANFRAPTRRQLEAALRAQQSAAPEWAGEIGAEYDAAAHCVTLAACPPGLFLFNGALGFKSEYGAMEPDDNSLGKLWKIGNRADAYCAVSGEYFWGGASNHDDRAKLLVYPIDADTVAMVSSHGPEALRAQQPAQGEAVECENCDGEGSIEYEGGDGEGWPSRPERDTCLKCKGEGRVAAHPAPSQQPADDKLRLAVDALEPFAAFGRFEAEVAAQAPDANPAPDDSVFKHWSDAFGMAGPKLVYGDLRRAAHALAALKAPAATEKADV